MNIASRLSLPLAGWYTKIWIRAGISLSATGAGQRAGKKGARTMARGTRKLEPKLEAVLAELCARLSGRIGITHAVKLPYLVDIVAAATLGHRITDATYEAWDYGVVSPEVWRFVRHGSGGGPFKTADRKYSEGGRELRLVGKPPAGVLTEREREVVALVADRFGKLSAANLGALTKSLNPEVQRWGSNEVAIEDRPTAAGGGRPKTPASSVRVDADADSFYRMGDDWQRIYRRLRTSDLEDRSLWGEEITDANVFVSQVVGE